MFAVMTLLGSSAIIKRHRQTDRQADPKAVVVGGCGGTDVPQTVPTLAASGHREEKFALLLLNIHPASFLGADLVEHGVGWATREETRPLGSVAGVDDEIGAAVAVPCALEVDSGGVVWWIGPVDGGVEDTGSGA